MKNLPYFFTLKHGKLRIALDIIHSEAEIQEVLEALINEYTFEEVEQCLNYLRPA